MKLLMFVLLLSANVLANDNVRFEIECKMIRDITDHFMGNYRQFENMKISNEITSGVRLFYLKNREGEYERKGACLESGIKSKLFHYNY